MLKDILFYHLQVLFLVGYKKGISWHWGAQKVYK